MAEFWADIVSRPGILALVVMSFALWPVAVWAILRSDRFLRKGWWIVLSAVTFPVHVWTGELTVDIAIPIGAAYVLWFVRYGKAPTDEQRAQRAVKPAMRHIGAGKLRVVRLAYGAMAVASLGLMVWAPLVSHREYLSLFDTGPNWVTVGAVPMLMRALAYGWAPIVMTVALFAFLAVRPYWWGKLICGFLAFGGIVGGLSKPYFLRMVSPDIDPVPLATVEIAWGLVALTCAITHHIVDPHSGGSYPRAAEQNHPFRP